MTSKYLQKIDPFGQSVLFKFNGDEKAKSPVGGCFALFLVAFVLWAAYLVGQDIVYRKQPKMIMSETFTENPEPFILSEETFNFAAGLQMPITYTHYINESIYTLEAHFNRQVREISENGTVKIKAEYSSLALERCTKEHFGNHGSKFENLELSEMFCLKAEHPGFDKLVLQGTFESPIFQGIEIVVKPCDPETSRVTCAPKDVIDEMLGSCYFAIYFTNLAIDAKNSNDPSLIFRDSYYTTASINFFKDIPLRLQHVQLKSDYGWLIQKKEIQNFVKVGAVGESAAFVQKEQKRMINLRIRMDKIVINYERSYLKISDIVALVNGFATIGFIIILLFIGPYSKIKFYERLINELFDLKMNHTAANKKNNKKNGKLNKKKSTKKYTESKTEADKSKMDNEAVELNIASKGNENSKTTQSKTVKKFIRFASDEHEKTNPEQNDTINRQTTLHSKLELAKRHEQQYSVSFNETKFLEVTAENSKSIKTRNLGLPDVSDDQSSPQKYLSKSTIMKVPTFKARLDGPEFLWKKPELVDIQPKIKVLANFEQSRPEEESFTVLETIIMENHERLHTKSKNLHRLISNREKVKKNKSMETTKKEIEEKIGTITEEESDVKTEDEEELDKQSEALSTHLSKEPDKLNISFKEYICSYFWKSKALKEKLDLLNEGIRRIEERTDIVNVLKKFREVDKLKLLLLENEQLVLFDRLPKPELLSKSSFNLLRRKSIWFGKFKDTRFIPEERKKGLILLSYRNVKKKNKKTMIDSKLLDIYDEIMNP